MKKVIIDTDPGIDDAMALACAFRQKKYEISLIIASAGNLNTDITSKNCMDLCYYFGRHFPVAKGSDMPVSGVITITAADIHGNNGLGGIQFPDSPYLIVRDAAKDAMYKMLVKNAGENKKGKTEIWLLGPATNVALMLSEHPDAAKYISRIVMMGGSIEGVNNSHEIYDEFNILYDPLAMQQVIYSQIPIVFVPMEIGHNCYLSHEEIEEFAKINRTTARFARMLRVYYDTHMKNHGAAQHDAAVIYYALYPHRFKKKNVFVHINLNGKIISQLEFSISPNKTNYILCFKTNETKFKQWLFKSFEKYF